MNKEITPLETIQGRIRTALGFWGPMRSRTQQLQQTYALEWYPETEDDTAKRTFYSSRPQTVLQYVIGALTEAPPKIQVNGIRNAAPRGTGADNPHEESDFSSSYMGKETTIERNARVERMLRATFSRMCLETGRDALVDLIFNAAAFGWSASKIIYDQGRDERGEWPLDEVVYGPDECFPDPAWPKQAPRYVVIQNQYATYADIRAMWPEAGENWPGNGDDNVPVRYTEYWDKTTRCFLIGGTTLIGPERHGFAGLPFFFVTYGAVNWSGRINATRNFPSLLGALDQTWREYNNLSAKALTLVNERARTPLVITAQRQWDDLYRPGTHTLPAALFIEREEEIHYLETPPLPIDLERRLVQLDNDMQVATFADHVLGAGSPSVLSGAARMAILTMTFKKLRPLVESLRRASIARCHHIMSLWTLMQGEHFWLDDSKEKEEPALIWLGGQKGKIAEDERSRWSINVLLEPGTGFDDVENATIAQALHGMLDNRTIAEQVLKIADYSAVERGLRRDALLSDPEITLALALDEWEAEGENAGGSYLREVIARKAKMMADESGHKSNKERANSGNNGPVLGRNGARRQRKNGSQIQGAAGIPGGQRGRPATPHLPEHS